MYTISSTEMKLRMSKYKDLIQEYQKPVNKDADGKRLGPVERLAKWQERLEVTKVALEVIAIPYLRTMDAQNSLYGVALKAYEQLFELAMSYGEDLAEIFNKGVTNKEEIMGGFEFFCQNYIKTWAFILISWSFGAQDVSPSYSVTVHAVGPQTRELPTGSQMLGPPPTEE